jgi:hypothetical protein
MSFPAIARNDMVVLKRKKYHQNEKDTDIRGRCRVHIICG